MTHFIYVSDMYELFKSGSYYENMTKADKRLMNMKNFDDKIQTNIYLKDLYISRKGYVNGVQISKPCIINFKEIPLEEEKSPFGKVGAEEA